MKTLNPFTLFSKNSTGFFSLKFFLLFAYLGLSTVLSAQDWRNTLNSDNPNPNFFTIRESFYREWDQKDLQVEKGWKPFKRWENFWESRVYKDGSFPPRDIVATEWAKYQEANAALPPSGNWTSMGPSTSSSGYYGIGRINCVAFHPSDANTFWVGTPAGGLWKTTTGGTSWTTNTDNFPTLGVSAIAVHPSNANIIYIGTGDGDGYDTYFYGVRKTTDGGTNWTTLSLSLGSFNVARKLLINPSTPATILAATSGGLYRSTNDGANWALVQSGDIYDMEFKPGDPTTVYASTGNQIYRSTNSGSSFTSVSTMSGSNRIALAVSAANTSLVGALSSASSNNGFNGFYTSTNSGASFALKSTSPNLLGSNEAGTSVGGQGSYDLCVAISPTDANLIFVGGVNTWKSTDGGTNWTINTMWGNSSTTQLVHADKHNMDYQNNTTLFQCNDGGIYRTTNSGTSWTDFTNGIVHSQMYRLGTAQTSTAVMTGLQDNSSKLRRPDGTWNDIWGTGDGMEGAIDPVNDKIAYTESYYGNAYRFNLNASYNVSTWAAIKPAGTSNGAWITPFVIDPTTPATLYMGFTNVYKSTDRGTAWTQISTGLSGSNLTILAVAPNNSNYIYASNGTNFYRTTNGGTSWSTLTSPSTTVSNIAVHPTNPSTIYISCSNYTAGQKVYKSTDGGSTWTNISGTLPNLPVNCVYYDKNATEGLYIGTDVGVYYRQSSMSDWVTFMSGLPNVIVREIEINYSTNKVLAATYGRGLWQSDRYSAAVSCATPTGLLASSITSSGATISWTAVSGGVSYLIEYKPSSSSTWSSISVSSALSGGLSYGLYTLAAGTMYDVRITATCSSGTSTPTSPISFTTLATTPCTAPATPSVSAIATTSATVSWTAVSGATAYRVEYKTAAAASWTALANTASTSQNLGPLVPATAYNVQVYSVCAGGNSVASTIANFTTFCLPPSTPTVSSIATTSATISWTAVSGATAYRVAYKLNSASTYTLLDVSTTSANLTGLTPNTLYNVAVHNLCTPSTPSAGSLQVNFTTLACTVPSTPAVSSITTNSATVSWAAVSGATAYRVAYKLNSASTYTLLDVSTTSANLTGLTPNTLYNVAVHNLCTPSTPSAASPQVNFTTQATGNDCSAPSQPTFTNLSAVGTTVNWTSVIGASTYQVEYKTAAASSWTALPITGRTYQTLNGLVPSTDYNVRVYATCSLGTSPPSVIGNFRTLDPPCLPTPTPTATDIAAYSATINWSSVLGATAYRVEYKTVVAATWTVLANTSSFNAGMTGLTPSTPYSVRVFTICGGTTSDASPILNFATLAPPTCPDANTPAISNLTSDGATVSWVVPAGVQSHRVEYKRTVDAGWSVWSTAVAGTSTVLTGLAGNTFYDVRTLTNCIGIVGINYSEIVSFRTLASICNPAPTPSVSSITASGAVVSWSAVSGATAYKLEYKTAIAASWTALANTSSTSVSLSGLSALTVYNVRLSVICAAGTGSPSGVVNFTTLAAPSCAAPSTPSVSAISSNGATVSWAAVSGATVYRVEYKTSAAGSWTALSNTSNTEVNLTGLLAATVYDVRVFTLCGSLTSAASPTATFTTLPSGFVCNATTAPTVSGITASGATINWAVALGAVAYRVEYKVASASSWIQMPNTGRTNQALSGLASSTQYNVRVFTVCDGATSSPSPTINFTTLAAPCTATSSPLVSNAMESSVTVSWAAVGGALAYRVEYKLFAGTSWTALPNVSSTTIQITGLTPSTAYNVRVFTICAASTSESSPVSSFATTASTFCPNPNTPFITNITISRATVNWVNPIQTESHRVEYKRAADATWIVWAAEEYGTSSLLVSLASGTTYQVRTFLTCGATSGANYSTVVSFTTLGTSPADPNASNNSSFGIGQKKNDLHLAIHPNPARANVNLRIATIESGEYDMLFFDFLGRAVIRQKISLTNGDNNLNVPLGNLPKGIYTIRILRGQESVVQKLSIQ